jgi:hypothetical protein
VTQWRDRTLQQALRAPEVLRGWPLTCDKGSRYGLTLVVGGSSVRPESPSSSDVTGTQEHRQDVWFPAR